MKCVRKFVYKYAAGVNKQMYVCVCMCVKAFYLGTDGQEFWAF